MMKMKWGGRKPSSTSSSSGSSFISHVSPFSWLSKFKQMRINSEPNRGKVRQRAKQNSPSAACGGNGGRFYGGDDEAFWRLSFGEEGHEDTKSKDFLKPVVCNLNDENVIPSSSCRGGRRYAKKHGGNEGTLKFKEKDIGLEDERKLLKDRKISLEMDEYNRGEDFESLRRRFERKAQRVLQEQLLKLEKEAEEVEFASSKLEEKDVLQFESPSKIWTPRIHPFASSADLKNPSLRSMVGDRVISTQSLEKTDRDIPSQKKLSSERQNLKQTEGLKVKTNKQRQSLHVSRENQKRKPKHSSKVRIYSPRMASKVEICKIKALEDMKKAKLKMKKEKEEIVEETTGLDSFAVIKCSFDPQQDFRDSMIEMIREKQISHPEEMEELLACYLTLNVDEYHDLIIKVFRQVWFDMSQDGLVITY